MQKKGQLYCARCGSHHVIYNLSLMLHNGLPVLVCRRSPQVQSLCRGDVANDLSLTHTNMPGFVRIIRSLHLAGLLSAGMYRLSPLPARCRNQCPPLHISPARSRHNQSSTLLSESILKKPHSAFPYHLNRLRETTERGK